MFQVAATSVEVLVCVCGFCIEVHCYASFVQGDLNVKECYRPCGPFGGELNFRMHTINLIYELNEAFLAVCPNDKHSIDVFPPDVMFLIHFVK